MKQKCGVKLTPTLYWVKISADINTTYGLMDLSLQLQKGMTIECQSYAIGHKFIYPICECWVKNLVKAFGLTIISKCLE